MSKQYKRIFSMYPAWGYQKMIEEFNKQSQQGWQLIRGGDFFNKFKKNFDVQYRYQMDYPGKVEDLGRYIETFREQGWEYVNSTMTGWSFFRKPWDPSLPEEQYEIFTDQLSLRQMINRWVKVVSVLAVIIAVLFTYFTVCFIRRPCLPTLILFLVYILIALFTTYNIVRMIRFQKDRTYHGHRAIMLAFLVMAFIGCGCYAYFSMHRPYFNARFLADEMSGIPDKMGNVLEWGTIDILYEDNYFLDLNIVADSPLCFTFLDESDKVLYTVTDDHVGLSDLKLHLEKGHYRMCYFNFEGKKLDVTCRIK